MTFFLLSVIIALFVSFVCSLMEATVLSLTPSQVADISARHPRQGAIWQGLKTNIERPIAVILILNTTAHTIGASFAGAQFDEIFGDEWIWLFGLVFTFLMLQYTEILPKTIGVRHNRRLAFIVATPLLVAVRIFTPLIRVIHFINKPFERGRAPNGAFSTVEEIEALAAMARMSKQIGAQQERIILGAARISRTFVRQVMIPVEQVAFLSTAMSIPEAVVSAHLDSHTRFPVCRGGDRNQVVGYINFKEMIYFMKTNPNDPSLEGVIRPVSFVDPDSTVADLLRSFVDQHVHMAVVRDKAGATLGIVTFEDAVEELVGEVEDEFDRLPHHVHELSSGMWLIGGGVPMREVAAKLGGRPAEVSGSLAEWIERQLTRSPRPLDSIVCDGVEVQVRRVRRGRAFEASVTAHPSSPQSATPPPAPAL